MKQVVFDSVVWRPLVLEKSASIIKSKEMMLSVDGKCGRISFNAAVCDSLSQILFYNTVEVLWGKQNDKPGENYLAFRFLQNGKGDMMLPLKKVYRDKDSKNVRGCYVLSRQLARMMSKAERVEHFHLCKCGDTLIAVDEPFQFEKVDV